MLELAYRSKLDNHSHHTYTLTRYAADDPFVLMMDGVVKGKLAKNDGKWSLIEGDMEQELIDDVGHFLETR